MSAQTSRTPTLAGYRALAELRYQIRRFLAFSESAARDAGLSPQQHQLLLALKGLPAGRAPTIRTLAERMQLRHHTTVELVDRLEDLGLLRRVRSGSREVRLESTRRGDTCLARLARIHRAELRALLPQALDALTALAALPRREDVTRGRR